MNEANFFLECPYVLPQANAADDTVFTTDAALFA